MSTSIARNTLSPGISLDHAASRRQVLVALALTLIGVAFLFVPEVTAAIHVWSVSTAYSHCFFVLPIALYLAWERRHVLRATQVEPLPAAAILALPLAGAWFVAERLGIMEGRQLIVLCLVQVVFLALLGWRMWRALSAPLLYLFFLVPSGAFLTPALQTFTARFVVTGLDILGIPNFSDDFQIDIPEGNFYVAEACAGLRFLIASIAFGVLYSCLIYRSPARRLTFIAVSIVVPVLANGIRALGIVTLGHVIGSAEAAAADHLIYGWVFFSAVILLLIAGGLPFREDQRATGVVPIPELRTSRTSIRPFRVAIAAAVILFLATTGPIAAALLDHAAGILPAGVSIAFDVPAGCKSVEVPAHAVPRVQGWRADTSLFECSGRVLTVSVVTFSPRVNPMALGIVQRDLTGEDRAEDATAHPLAIAGISPGSWRETDTGEPARVTVSSFWINGVPAQAGLRGRATQALNSVIGSHSDPVLVAVSLDWPEKLMNTEARTQSVALITRFLAAQPGLDDHIRASARH